MTDFSKNKPVYHPHNKELRDKLSVMNAKFMGKDESFDPFYGAQELLIVLANKAMPTYLYDGTLVLGNLMNAAADLGVDSCWINFFDPEAAAKELHLPENEEVLMLLDLGYAAEGASPLANHSQRKELSETVKYI